MMCPRTFNHLSTQFFKQLLGPASVFNGAPHLEMESQISTQGDHCLVRPGCGNTAKGMCNPSGLCQNRKQL